MSSSTRSKRLHLLCNAHIDPYWLWEWEEGAAAAISTFRAAADFCEEFDGFVFNHNEVILYRWVEEFEPALFKRIQRLVKAGKWSIMGGWYLQPDCNMPSGESFVRQALLGKRYFMEKFGVEPTTANNFDSFGHTRGLVQILKKAGYDSYMHCRPNRKDCPLPGDVYLWVGYDGSEIVSERVPFYGTPLGGARKRVEEWMAANPDRPLGMMLWGVGNHGGGPSRKDLRDLADLMKSTPDTKIVHSKPGDYFREVIADANNGAAPLPRHAGDLNAWAVGCYTSMVRSKQLHRLLENELYMTEKMLSHAVMAGLLDYPMADLHEAQRDLLTAEFHDLLPGSAIQPVEQALLRLLDHGLEICSRLKARAFFALSAGQPVAKEGEYPILVYNSHPFPVNTIVECEFQLADGRWEGDFTLPVVYRKGKKIACQTEKEESSIPLDWRKRLVFHTELAPGQMNRFDVRIDAILPEKPKPQIRIVRGKIVHKTDDLEVVINARTGLIDSIRTAGVDYVRKNAFQPIVIDDNEDPWGMLHMEFPNQIGAFELMTPEEGTRYSGLRGDPIESVRVIEEGEVRTVVEALLKWNHSFCVIHYNLPKRGAEIEIEVRVQWNEKDKMLKLSVPCAWKMGSILGQVACGVESLPTTGKELVAQKWIAALDDTGERALTVVNNGTYALDYSKGEIRLSLLRSPAYSAHPINDRRILPQDRFMPRMDQGERIFRFWINPGPAAERITTIDREALVMNERPFALAFFPSGQGQTPKPSVSLGDAVVQLQALKQAEDGGDFILRLFEPTGKARTTTVKIPLLGMTEKVKLTPYELKSLRLSPKKKTLKEVDLLER